MSAAHLRFSLLMLSALACTPGCASFEALRGDGFQSWNQSLGSGMRGNDAAAKPSGFFTDKRSEQIEKNLGGGF